MLKLYEDGYAVPVRKTIAKTSGGRRDAQHIGVRVDFEVSIAQDLGDPRMEVYSPGHDEIRRVPVLQNATTV